MIPVGGPDGKPAIHSIGSKGLHERVRDETNRTGKRSSPLNLRISLNKKKDKTIDEQTGDFTIQDWSKLI
ncbi:hypothetical protein LIER_20832 [Lithospermum erythrorhizon]|uniref:Uncharacterized protein n=1 Tax=Lithospermum erythrorhizon TaxID=34254 RepID=A0AAV3QRD0_LITER